MYALIVAIKDEDQARLLATARSLPAIQGKWKRLINQSCHNYRFVGILTGSGLMNYYGMPINDPINKGYKQPVECIMRLGEIEARK